jgi:hypothetical protein
MSARARVIALVMAAAGAAAGAGRAVAAEAIGADGTARLDAGFGRTKVQVEVQARDHAVAALAIRVDGYPLAVPPAAAADLADPASVDVTRRDDGLFVLHLTGTPAAGPWTAEIVFDRLGLREARVLDAASGAVLRATAFGAPELLD